MTIGVSKERLETILDTIRHDAFGREHNLILSLLNDCKELHPWQPIDDAPKDRDIAVYAPSYQGLPSMVSKCKWHDDAGFCIDELRQPTHWCELP